MKKIISHLSILLALTSCMIKDQEINLDSNPNRNISYYDINYNDIKDEDLNKTIVISETVHTLNGVNLNRYMYTDEEGTVYPAGMPLVVKEKRALNLHIINQTQVDTNIHWHGLSLPNDQDGPHLLINNKGGEYDYSFTPDYSGSYWYHSHNRPVRDQVDFGMHGPLIILNESDKQYTFDRILMLDDWLVYRNTGRMQIEGDIDTVNGLTGDEIEPIVITNNDFVKLRLIQASTAKNTKLYFPFPVRVTHMDGIALEEPFETNEIELSPAERYDVDFRLTNKKDEVFIIRNERNEGLIIPIYYTYVDQEETISQLKAPVEREDNLSSSILDKPDIFVTMDSRMRHGRGHEWTINGEIFPYAEEFELELGKEYLIRFDNASRMFNHPMHIHGAHFKVISINGYEPSMTVWKDTINVLPRQYVDVAIRFDNPGEWMLHCHILDHEDGGMMTTIIVK